MEGVLACICMTICFLHWESPSVRQQNGRGRSLVEDLPTLEYHLELHQKHRDRQLFDRTRNQFDLTALLHLPAYISILRAMLIMGSTGASW